MRDVHGKTASRASDRQARAGYDRGVRSHRKATREGLLDIRVERESPRATRLIVAGELDMCTSPLLLSRIAGAGEGRTAVVTVDLSGLGFADLSGLRAFHAAARSLGSDGTRLVLAAPQPQVRRLLTMTKTDRFVEVRGS